MQMIINVNDVTNEVFNSFDWKRDAVFLYIYAENLPSGLSNEVIPARDIDDL